MRITAIINLKGGVGKTTTAINLSYQLYLMGKRVLLIDMDKQANVSKFYKIHSNDRPSIADVLLEKSSIDDCAHFVEMSGNGSGASITVVPSNMSLLSADSEIIIDNVKPQQTRLKMAIEPEAEYYDYCIIDCAPDINMGVINALVVSDDVIIPVTIDQFTFDGINEIEKRIDDVRRYYNPKLKIGGCLITSYHDSLSNRKEVGNLYVRMGGKVYNSIIKYSAPVSGSTFKRQPLAVYSPRCAASRGYKEFAEEYIKGEQ